MKRLQVELYFSSTLQEKDTKHTKLRLILLLLLKIIKYIMSIIFNCFIYEL